MEENNSRHSNMIIIFSIIILLLITIGVSFAWYQAKEANSIINDLNTAGIKIDLNTKDSNTLTPDILKEGVLNNTNKLPDDYDSKKSSGDKYYVESFGNSVAVKEDIKIIFDSYIEDNTSKVYTTATFTISIKYLDKDGKVVDLTNFADYFALKYAMVTKGSNYDLAEYKGEFKIQVDGDYDLHLSVAYKLPDELLPAELVNSSCITIYISSELS